MQVTTSNAAGGFGGERLGRDLAVVDVLGAGFERMQLRHLQRLGRQVDAEHVGAAARHRLGEDAAAAADVEHALAAQAGEAVDPVQPQRVDLVQRPEFARRCPTSGGRVR